MLDDEDHGDDNDYDDGGGGGAATEYEYKENDEDDIYDDESNIKNEDAFNDDDLNKIDDLIDNDLDEENVLFTKRTAGNKRKLNEIDTKVWREHNNNNNNSNKTNKIKEDNDIGSTAKVQKTFIDGMLKLKRNQSASPSNISSTVNSPSSPDLSPNSYQLSLSSSAFTTKCNNNNNNKKSTAASNPSDHFSLIVKNTANSIDNKSLSCECLQIEAVSKNCIYFLKQTQVRFIVMFKNYKLNYLVFVCVYPLNSDFIFMKSWI